MLRWLLLLLLPLTAQAAFEAERQAFALAHRAAGQAPEAVWRPLAEALRDYPLFPYLEHAALTRRLASAEPGEVQDFLRRHGDIAPAASLRRSYLLQLAERGDSAAFLELYQDSREESLRCHAASARARLDRSEGLAAEVESLWLHGRSRPKSCDDAFAWWRGQGQPDAARVEARLILAAEAGEVGLSRWLHGQLPAARQESLQVWLDLAAGPGAALQRALRWPAAASSADAATGALLRQAARDSEAAISHWQRLQDRLPFTTAQRGQILAAIALYRAVGLHPNAEEWLNRVTDPHISDSLREWRVRVALFRADWQAALEALDALSPPQQREARWRYLRARVAAKLGNRDGARTLFQGLAGDANYHGFLAADFLAAPYALCPATLADSDADLWAQLQSSPALLRALELHALGWLHLARQEWHQGLAALGDADLRRRAVALAMERGWYERGVWNLASDDDRSYYALRFPVPWRSTVEASAAAQEQDPAWVFALMRAESALAPDARSRADARGLMQLLPATGAETARRIGLPLSGRDALYQPEINIRLGTAYLGHLSGRFQGSPVLTAAAYNAGPTRVRRWLDRGGPVDPDLWIETLPFPETRDYVPRLLSFSVIYDWRLHGKSRRIGTRMPRIGEAPVATDAWVESHCPEANGVSP